MFSLWLGSFHLTELVWLPQVPCGTISSPTHLRSIRGLVHLPCCLATLSHCPSSVPSLGTMSCRDPDTWYTSWGQLSSSSAPLV